MEKAFSTPKNEMKNSCGEAVYHNAYLYFSLICHFCENRYRWRGEGRGGGLFEQWMISSLLGLDQS